MNDTSLSKFLSLVLRHQPEVIDLHLDENGWASVEELMDKMRQQKNISIDYDRLKRIVSQDNKNRYSLNETEGMIRANQGHSIQVSLDLRPIAPPAVLFHGTATRFLDSIQEIGLLKMGRNHVHLSKDYDTARIVGKRHGKPVILEINAELMMERGFEFFLSENKVWLTEEVPPMYLKVHEG